MLRRNLIGAALALPAAQAASTLAGSSVAPIGKATAAWCPSTHYWDGDGCVRRYVQQPPQWDGYKQFNMAYNATVISVGAAPFPAETVFNVPRDQVGFHAQLDGTQYADFNDLANLIELGYVIGGAYGFMRAGPRGSVVAGSLVAGTLALGWLAYNFSVVMYKYPTSILGTTAPPPSTIAGGTPLTLHGTNAGSLSYGLPAGGTITGGIGTGGWTIYRSNRVLPT